MRNGILIGMAVGALLGAMFVEGNQPAAEMMQKGKKTLKKNIQQAADSLTGSK